MCPGKWKSCVGWREWRRGWVLGMRSGLVGEGMSKRNVGVLVMVFSLRSISYMYKCTWLVPKPMKAY